MAARRYRTIVGHLTDTPAAAVELVERLDDATLAHLGAAVADEVRRRARAAGDLDAVIGAAFEQGFDHAGLAHDPWIEGPLLVCPGGLVGRSQAAHRCRFVSVDGVWVWESSDLVREDKRSHPGEALGFRAVAVVAPREGLELDVVSARLRRGRHGVERVVSYLVRRGELVEVAAREVSGRALP